MDFRNFEDLQPQISHPPSLYRATKDRDSHKIPHLHVLTLGYGFSVVISCNLVVSGPIFVFPFDKLRISDDLRFSFLGAFVLPT